MSSKENFMIEVQNMTIARTERSMVTTAVNISNQSLVIGRTIYTTKRKKTQNHI